MTKTSPDEKRRRLTECVSQCCHRWYDAQGCWRVSGPKPDARKALWLCFGLLAGGKKEVALANAILGSLEFQPHIHRYEEATGVLFDIFVTNHSVQMLVQHSSRLDTEVREKLEKWGRAALCDYPGDRQADYQFHGFNDNMPAKASLGMILGGEYFGDGEAIEHGLWNLRQLRSLLSRRGLLSEYTSPTYLPATLVNLTEIALHARCAEARELAALCTERLWSDLLGHFHPPTATLGGPSSRSYQLDSTGHFSTAACLLWLVPDVWISFDPVEEINHDPMRLVHHHDDRATQLGILCWIASCELQPPAPLLKWLNERQYPFRLQASAERGGEGAGEINTTFYTEEDFALGSAEGESWSQLQSEVCFLQYRRRAPFQGVEDLRTAYTRFLINDQRPGDRMEDHLFKPHGLLHTVQKDRVAMVLARPVLSLADKELHTMKLSVILPAHFGELERIEVSNDHVFCQDGPVRFALRPLNLTDWGRPDSIKIERAPNYQICSFFNYEGPARKFSGEELARTLNGFVMVAGLTAEESFEQFRDRVSSAELLDCYFLGSRTVTYRLGEVSLALSYHVKNDRVKYALIDDRLAPRPLWEADDLPQECLPFLGARAAGVDPLNLPFSHLNVVWSRSPWMISTGGKKVCSECLQEKS